MAAETGWFRTESGTVMEMDLPLPEGIAQRVDKGEIVRVAGADGGEWVPPEAPPTPAQELADVRAELEEARARAEVLESERDEALDRVVELQAELAALKVDAGPTEPPVEPEPPAAKPPAKATRTKQS